MCTYIYMYIYLWIYIYMYIWIVYIYMNIYIYIYVYTCIYKHIYEYIYIYTYCLASLFRKHRLVTWHHRCPHLGYRWWCRVQHPPGGGGGPCSTNMWRSKRSKRLYYSSVYKTAYIYIFLYTVCRYTIYTYVYLYTNVMHIFI